MTYILILFKVITLHLQWTHFNSFVVVVLALSHVQLFATPMDCRLLCPPLSPRVCSNSCPLSQWCHPTILTSVIPCSFCLQSFPASGSFLIGQLFASGGQCIGTSSSVSVLPANKYSELFSFRIDWFDLLAVQGTLKSLLQHHNLKASVLQHSAFFMVWLSHPYITIGKTIALTIWTFVSSDVSVF